MDIAQSIGRGFSLSGESIGQGLEFAKLNWKRVFLYLVFSTLAVIAFAGIGGVLAVAAAYLLPNYIGWSGAITAALAIFSIFFVAGLSYSFGAMFGAMEYIYGGKKIGYFESTNVKTGFMWAALSVIVVLLVMLLFVGAIVSMAAAPIIGMALFMIFYLLFIALAILVSVVAYYAIYEGALKKKGPIGAIKSSFALLKGNFWETIVFAILIGAVSYIGGMVMMLIFYAFYFAGIFATLLFPVAGIALFVVAFMALILLSVLMQCFILPMQVLFYKKIVEGRGMEAPKKKEATKPAGKAVEIKKTSKNNAKRK